MIGHDSGKPGDWYEEEFVVLQLFRLLNGELGAVTWELEHEDGEGIDCKIIEAPGQAVAIQCKTRSTDQWTLERLNSAGVLQWVVRRLDELRWKFGDTPTKPLEVSSGCARSVVPDGVAARWGAREWLRRLRDPGLVAHWTSPKGWHDLGPGAIGVYDRSSLLRQLKGLAERNPRRYLPLALELNTGDAWDGLLESELPPAHAALASRL